MLHLVALSKTTLENAEEPHTVRLLLRIYTYKYVHIYLIKKIIFTY